jgi:hypothetical protein
MEALSFNALTHCDANPMYRGIVQMASDTR